MNKIAHAALRLMWLTYPKPFRNSMGAEMWQTTLDRARAGHESALQILVSEGRDVLTVACTMRAARASTWAASGALFALITGVVACGLLGVIIGMTVGGALVTRWASASCNVMSMAVPLGLIVACALPLAAQGDVTLVWPIATGVLGFFTTTSIVTTAARVHLSTRAIRLRR